MSLWCVSTHRWHTVSLLLLGVVTIGGSVIAALAGMLCVRRWVPAHILDKHRDVAGFKYAVVGVIYAVTLALVVLATWTDFEKAEVFVDQEAVSLRDIFRLSEALPAAAKRAIQIRVQEYARAVINDEWDAMDRGRESTRAHALAQEVWNVILSLEPQTAREQVAFAALVTRLNDFRNNRDLRLLASRQALPGVMWTVLISGGLITVVFTYFFRVETLWAQGLMTALLALTIGLNLFLIAALDNPFKGRQVSPRAFETLLD